MENLFMKCVLFFAWLVHGRSALREVQILVPAAVRVGDAVTLTCRWSLEAGETLYSVKWYKGGQEFYRYIPKELPHTRVFPHPAINVDVSRSNERQVALRGASRALAGRFRCEVSADAPSFHTEMRSAYMHIVELPESAPIISAEKGWYAAGDRLRARCTAPPADPPANLTWLLNGREVQGVPIQYESTPSSKPVEIVLSPPSSVTPVPPSHDSETNSLIFAPWSDQDGPTDDSKANINSNLNDLEPRADASRTRLQRAGFHDSTPRSDDPGDGISDSEPEVSNKLPSASRLSFTVKTDSFERGRLSLTCISSVHSVYSARAELVIEEERPQIASVLGTRESNSGAADRPSRLMVAASVISLLLTLRSWMR